MTQIFVGRGRYSILKLQETMDKETVFEIKVHSVTEQLCI